MSRPFPPVEHLGRVLGQRPDPPVEDVNVMAAVIACLHEDAVLLLRRSDHPEDPWSGHVGLPGGRHDAGDGTLLHTALREAREEVGFDPLDHGRVLGPLGTYTGRGRRVTGVRIGVFVAALDRRPTLELSHEVASAHWVPLDHLVPGEAPVPEYPDGTVPAYTPEVAEGHRLTVWGITYGILEQLRAVE